MGASLLRTRTNLPVWGIGVLVLKNALAWLERGIKAEDVAGDHWIVVSVCATLASRARER